jgi:hypothetical protein
MQRDIAKYTVLLEREDIRPVDSDDQLMTTRSVGDDFDYEP